ncbi:hypothetical protein RclHR1_04380003 [Rhizophagus clarus]|uniref:Putative altered inheritance of mitochondria protein 13, mitochondrial n=1 Tax=Rhizophagus clarus TaxID=94130 RepID=A0A2Z6RZG7_9GLOM|nr:hypothetical protein RclHR1_04380003 [Rhizophagus clarus]GES85459.1 putative altered inheritance of mitochondria protein 13, mitochondrial [Rhizophagus clarus]
MGAKQSVDSQPPITIYNEPNVRFSHGLVEQLQREKERAKQAKQGISQPTTYYPSGDGQVLNEEMENIIKVRVEDELRKIRERDDEVAQRVQEELFRQGVTLSDSGASSAATEHDINELIERIERKYKNNVSSEIIEQQRAVISCYRNNTSRTLDCWEEVQKFKRVTRDAAQNHIASHNRF